MFVEDDAMPLLVFGFNGLFHIALGAACLFMVCYFTLRVLLLALLFFLFGRCKVDCNES